MTITIEQRHWNAALNVVDNADSINDHVGARPTALAAREAGVELAQIWWYPLPRPEGSYNLIQPSVVGDIHTELPDEIVALERAFDKRCLWIREDARGNRMVGDDLLPPFPVVWIFSAE